MINSNILYIFYIFYIFIFDIFNIVNIYKMNYNILKLNDKYYTKYNYLFNYSSVKFNIINLNLLFNYTFSNDASLCNKSFIKYNYHEYYGYLLFNNIKQIINYKNKKLNLDYSNFIIDKINKIYNNNSNKTLYIINSNILPLNYIYNKKNNIGDVIFLNNMDYSLNILTKNYNNFINNIKNNKLFNNYYSSFFNNEYKQFIINLKNNEETSNIPIPKQKYDLINFHIGYITGLGLSSSFKMMLHIPQLISAIAMSLKLIEKDGTLLLFWSIVNVNIPVIQKILSILSYGFKSVEIIDNDINQNLVIGVPEYYIKCHSYKNNITNEIINKLLDISIKTVDYTYDKCDIIDYYEDYSKKNHNHSLFYNKKEDLINKYSTKRTTRTASRIKSRTKSSYTSKTRKLSFKSSKSHIPITPIYYIEDINIPELDIIMKDSNLQFKVSLLMNKLEGIFVDYFEMVNNLIVNAIAYDKKGDMYIKKEAILKKDITNLTRLINMFEVNKLPYNKHALKVLLGKQDELIKNFYSLDIPVNIKIINYTDRNTKYLNKNAINNFNKSVSKSLSSSNKSNKNTKNIQDYDIINYYYDKIKLSQQTKYKILEDINFTKYFNKAPRTIEYASYNFAPGLCEYINNKYKFINTDINIQFVKLWEILNEFELIPNTVKSFKILHLCELTGQSIMCAKHWVETKCINLDMNNYQWLANGINPYSSKYKNIYKTNKTNKTNESNNIYYNNLINDNYDKWLWGLDNTGEINNINNIKSIMNDIKLKWEIKSGKKISNNIDLIICDDNIEFDQDKLDSKNADLYQVLSIIACSSIGGSFCAKHFIPYKNINDLHNIDNMIELSEFFINYLYLYYILFDSISLYKPNSSKTNNGEFYVIGKGFKGITTEHLENLFNVIDNFTEYNYIIDYNKIPLTFVYQLNNFLENMSNINIVSIEKQILLLTCYKNLYEDNKDNEDGKNIHRYKQTNKILKCNNFFNKKNIDNMLTPKYKEWIKIFNFQ